MTYHEAAYKLVKAYDDPNNKTIAATVAAVFAEDTSLDGAILTNMALAIDAYVDAGKLIHHGS